MYDLLRLKRQRLIGFVAVAGLLVSALSSFAQLRDYINLPEADEKTYHIGIVIMGASSRLQVSLHPQFLQNDSILSVNPVSTGGLGIGGMHTLRLSQHFEVRVVFPQLLFVNKNLVYQVKYPGAGETPVMTKNIESILLGIPVQLKFESDRIDNFRVYMMGGFKYETDLASKARAQNADDIVKLKNSDFGIEAGLGFNFYMRYFILSPEIKVSNGISNVHSRDPNLKFSSVIDKIQSRQVVFSLIFEG